MHMSQIKRFWLDWIVRNTLIGFISWTAIALAAFFTWGMALGGLGILLGISLGWVQGKLLDSYTLIRQYKKWVKHSIIGATIGWGAIMMMSVILILMDIVPNDIFVISIVQLLLISVGGGIFGFIQWSWTLGRSGAVRWAAAHAVGWGIGSALGSYISGIIIPYSTGRLFSTLDAVSVFIIGVVATVTFSMVTSFVLHSSYDRLGDLQPDTE